MLALLAYPFHFLHKAWLLLNYDPTRESRWQQWAGMRDGQEHDILQAPKLFGKDEWLLRGGRVVASREIFMILDRSDFGY